MKSRLIKKRIPIIGMESFEYDACYQCVAVRGHEDGWLNGFFWLKDGKKYCEGIQQDGMFFDTLDFGPKNRGFKFIKAPSGTLVKYTYAGKNYVKFFK